MKKYCDVNAFSDRLKHYHTWQRCPLYWIEICSLFFLSSRMFLTPCAVQVAVMSDLWHFWMNLVVYILSHAMFSKGMLHWSALADALQHHECDHYVQMKKKKSTIFDFIVQPRPFCCSQIARFYFWWHLKKESGHGMKLCSKSAWH